MNLYNELLIDDKWLEFRKRILQRDGNKCRNCFKTGNLHVHHRQYLFIKKRDAFIKPWEYPQKCLVTLCVRCHTIGHKNYKIPIIYI